MNLYKTITLIVLLVIVTEVVFKEYKIKYKVNIGTLTMIVSVVLHFTGNPMWLPWWVYVLTIGMAVTLGDD